MIEDCSRAIELNPKYIKCIQRRARAAETIDNFELALEGELTERTKLFGHLSRNRVHRTTFFLDYSTVCFLDSYQPAYIMAADKVLTDLAKRYVETLPAVSNLSRSV